MTIMTLYFWNLLFAFSGMNSKLTDYDHYTTFQEKSYDALVRQVF